MGLKKGKTNNPNGRPKGSKMSKKKLKELVEHHIDDLLVKELPIFKERIGYLNHKDYCTIMAPFIDKWQRQNNPPQKASTNTQININGNDQKNSWEILVVDASAKTDSIIELPEGEKDSEDDEDDEKNDNE